MATVTVTVELSFEADETSAAVVADILRSKLNKNQSTMIGENTGVYDYSPQENIIGVEVS